ncbi:kinase-like domain-containing protein, partial [Naematelia encephala]
LPRMIDNGRVELHGTIGTGAYGQVYLAIDRRYSQPAWRAVKCLRRNGLDARQKHFQRREIALHRLASSHPSIVHMDRLIEDGEHLYVVMDYGEEGDLFAMITDKQRYVGDDELIRSVFLQLVDGIAFLHSLGIAHRDVKPENIVCSEHGTRVRICDFGLATSEVESGEFGCGSTFYIAPECLGDWDPEQKSYPTRPGDVWSLGVILVNLVCGRNPWRIASPTDESFNAFLRDPYFLRRILPISEDCLYVLTRIFTLEPSERASLPELRQLITEVRSFTMTEEELLRAHAAA